MKRLLAACAVLALGACTTNPGATPVSAMDAAATRTPRQVPAACTVPPAVSGHDYFSISAIGRLSAGKFSLAQPSSWTEVEWLKVPPPQALRDAAAGSTGGYVAYWGTYRVSNGTSGCLYLTAPSSGGRASLTALPRIPPKGATLPVDFGKISSLALTIDAGGRGTGQATLVREDGSAKATATLTIEGTIR